MNPKEYRKLKQLLADFNAKGPVLEIGAVPTDDSLLTIPLFKGEERIGIDLQGGEHREFEIIEGDANNMEAFDDDKFETVICANVLEHDPRFLEVNSGDSTRGCSWRCCSLQRPRLFGTGGTREIYR